MSVDIFLRAVKELAERRLNAMAAIGAAENVYHAGHPDLAAQLYQLWIGCNPADPFLHIVYYNLGASLTAAGDHSNALQAFEQSVAIHPDFHPARINLGVAAANIGDTEAALEHWRTVVTQLEQVNPTTLRHKKMALRHMAYHLQQSDRYAEAEAALRQNLALDCHQQELAQHWLSLRQEQCIWPMVVPLEGFRREDLLRIMLPLSLAAFTDDPILQLASSCLYSRSIALPKPGAPSHVVATPLSGRRRIGYLSSDLRAHAVGYLVPEVFELHDKNEFEVFAYYCGAPTSDPLSARLKRAVEHWVDLTGMDDETAAARICADGIDILVDLNGHTRDARTAVVFLRPAPIIVNWLGYPGTMGSAAHHYLITDDWIVPPGDEIYYSEKVLRLPCYQPNDRRRTVLPEMRARSEFGVPDDAVVYCCFNSTHKITRFTFERWMEILRRVPNSVLWLFETSPTTSARLRSLAEQQGIASERLIFATRLSNPLHLARYPLADLFLDTAPYGAHTTGSDALWMGLPILTLSGRSFASRVCGSLVRAAGLPELVCTTPEDYVERAVHLGQNRQELDRLKEHLASQRTSCILFDMDAHVRALEALYRHMWDEYLHDRLPEPDLTNLDIYLELGLEYDPDQAERPFRAAYLEWYRERLAHRHRLRPIAQDQRLWSSPKSSAETL